MFFIHPTNLSHHHDCLPHALALATYLLLGRRVGKSIEHELIAAQMRSLLHSHQERNWNERAAVAGDQTWATLVTLAHNQAISELERAQFDDWGSDPSVQLARWLDERADLYCGMPELLAYVSLCHETGARVGLRVWRQVAGKLQLMTRLPEPEGTGAGAGAGEPLFVLDLQLTGAMDSAAAHYKLLQSGSLSAGEPGNKKRKLGGSHA